ncbi:MAG: hypothetical protein O3C23_01350 [bacterium]|nr:hypothetical protein [bacterium]
MEESRFFNKSAWKGIVIAIVAVVLVQMALAWQYYRLEEKRIPQIEQELAKQKEERQQDNARATLTSFLDAWQQGNAALAERYLTENAVLQEQQGIFFLDQGFSSYQIVKLEKLENDEFRVQVEKQTQQGLPPRVEILRVLKILDSYYIDSIEIAG